MTHPTPTRAGFYWAKWRIADDGTDDDGYCMGTKAEWEVVEVWDQIASEVEDLRVWVLGVKDDQSVENFFWGPGPLEAPT